MALKQAHQSKHAGIPSPLALLRLGFIAFLFAALVQATVPASGATAGFDGKSSAQTSDTLALFRHSARALGSEAQIPHIGPKALQAGGASNGILAHATNLHFESDHTVARHETQNADAPLPRAFDARGPPVAV